MANPNIVSVATINGKTDSGELNTTYTTSLVTNSAASGKIYKINSLVCTNKAGTDTTFRFSFYNGSTDRFIAYNVNCPANTVVIVTDKNSSFYLEEGDSVRGGAATNSRLDYVISYEEIS
tara:strand:- start:3 stop:362 length:360 start_codon:yes stop_codon:yes gene_type:complete